jgi:hypothetical protein
MLQQLSRKKELRKRMGATCLRGVAMREHPALLCEKFASCFLFITYSYQKEASEEERRENLCKRAWHSERAPNDQLSLLCHEMRFSSTLFFSGFHALFSAARRKVEEGKTSELNEGILWPKSDS